MLMFAVPQIVLTTKKHLYNETIQFDVNTVTLVIHDNLGWYDFASDKWDYMVD